MGVHWKLFLIVSFLTAMKIGWNLVPQEPHVQVDLMEELQSVWEAEAINSAKPFHYHLQIDNSRLQMKD